MLGLDEIVRVYGGAPVRSARPAPGAGDRMPPVGEVTRRITAVHVVGGLDPVTGGPARTVPRLCQALAGRGADVRLVTRAVGGLPAVEGVSLAGVPARRLGWRHVIHAPGFARVLAAQCAGTGPVVLHDHGLWLNTNHAAARVARRLGIPRVVSPRGMLDPWPLAHQRWKKRLAWWLYQRRDLRDAELVVATSPMEAGYIRRLLPGRPVAVVPNAVDLPPERPRPVREDDIRTALFLSRLHPKKGLVALLAAWARVRPAGWRLVIAGPDEDGYARTVARRIQALGLGRDVILRGPVAGVEKDALFRAADLFVLPSHAENFGMVVAEALAYGLPVITTRRTPWEDLPAHGCGWWVEDSPDALARALSEACAAADDGRREMGARGRRLVAERYHWDRVARRTLAVYRRVISARHGRRAALPADGEAGGC